MLLLQKMGVKIAIITGKSSDIVQNRMSALGVSDIYQGQKNKLMAFTELLNKYQLQPEEVGYMGDDLPDLRLMRISGISFAPQDAVDAVLNEADFVSKYAGGQGAVREVCELFIKAHNKYEKMLDDYARYGEARF
jgi:3-deoxy-D-manno-octulosonate 8-phosphate phosphatase (KDO 8-P phosphatase)